MKIAVIGYTGSGKSVLAAKLGKIIGCPVLHLDKLQFEAGWKERGEAEGKMLCEQFLEENKDRGWVIDGNYEKFCQKRRMKEADLIILWIIQDGSACGRRCAVITDTKAIPEKAWQMAV